MVGETGPVSILGAPVALFAGATIALIFSAALAIRRWSPPIALALAWAGAVLQMALGRPPTVADLAIFGVLYVTAAYGTRAGVLGGLRIGAGRCARHHGVPVPGPTFAGGGLSCATLPLAVAVLVAAAFALLLSWTVGALVRTAVRAQREPRSPGARRGRGGRRAGARADRARHARRRRPLARRRDRAGRRGAVRRRSRPAAAGARRPRRSARSRRPPARRSPTYGCC